MGRKGKVIWNGGGLINVSLYEGFFDLFLTKPVAEIMFSQGCALNVLFVAFYLINEIRGRAGDVMSYTSLFVGEKKESIN